MEVIKYRTGSKWYCTHNCPHGMTINKNNLEIRRVGGGFCAVGECPHCSFKDTTQKIVHCTYKDDNEMTLEEASKEIERLQKYIKRKAKAWPDTIEEMKEESLYWGFEIINRGNDKYMIITNGPATGYPIQVSEYWTSSEDLKDYIKQDGTIDEYAYRFIKFDTAKELYLWMAEGEE